MAEELTPCGWCGHSFPADQLTESHHHGGKVCQNCRADQGPDHFRGITKKIDREEVEA